MRVRTGWSGETQSNVWQKVAIELEEDDLARMLMEHGLPSFLHERLPALVAYELLQSQADILLLRKLITLGYPQDKALTRVNELSQMIAAIMASAHEKIAEVDEPEQPSPEKTSQFTW